MTFKNYLQGIIPGGTENLMSNVLKALGCDYVAAFFALYFSYPLG